MHVQTNIPCVYSLLKKTLFRFPNFDFSEIIHDEDVFYTDERETDEHCCDRAVKFLEWLNKRPEKCIAVVTHSSFLRHLFGQFGESLAQQDMDNLQRLAGNCELRSVVLCSHGVKDGKNIDPLQPPSSAPSTGETFIYIILMLSCVVYVCLGSFESHFMLHLSHLYTVRMDSMFGQEALKG